MRSTACARARRDRGIDRHLLLEEHERLEDLRQRDALHMRAEIARPHELDLGRLDRDVVAHRALGHEQHLRSAGGPCTHLIMPLVEPVKSASASTSGAHSGWAMIFTPGSLSR